MQQRLFFLIPLLFLSNIVFAQMPPTRKELSEQRNKYVCQELQLTDSECEVVSKALNELDAKRIALWQEHKRTAKKLLSQEKVSKEEVVNFVQKSSECREQESKLLEECYIKLCDQISPEKVIRLERAQRNFGRKFFKQKRK